MPPSSAFRTTSAHHRHTTAAHHAGKSHAPLQPTPYWHRALRIPAIWPQHVHESPANICPPVMRPHVQAVRQTPTHPHQPTAPVRSTDDRIVLSIIRQASHRLAHSDQIVSGSNRCVHHRHTPPPNVAAPSGEAKVHDVEATSTAMRRALTCRPATMERQRYRLPPVRNRPANSTTSSCRYRSAPSRQSRQVIPTPSRRSAVTAGSHHQVSKATDSSTTHRKQHRSRPAK